MDDDFKLVMTIKLSPSHAEIVRDMLAWMRDEPYHSPDLSSVEKEAIRGAIEAIDAGYVDYK